MYWVLSKDWCDNFLMDDVKHKFYTHTYQIWTHILLLLLFSKKMKEAFNS